MKLSFSSRTWANRIIRGEHFYANKVKISHLTKDELTTVLDALRKAFKIALEKDYKIPTCYNKFYDLLVAALTCIVSDEYKIVTITAAENKIKSANSIEEITAISKYVNAEDSELVFAWNKLACERVLELNTHLVTLKHRAS